MFSAMRAEAPRSGTSCSEALRVRAGVIVCGGAGCAAVCGACTTTACDTGGGVTSSTAGSAENSSFQLSSTLRLLFTNSW